MEKLLQNILKKIESGEEISPFLFTGKNLDLLNEKVKKLSVEILDNFNIPQSYIFCYEDSPESIKIKEMKVFLEGIHQSTAYKVQIFIIENISRFTLSAGNSLLKILEEPGKQNIIFLTNQGENGILETILSRVSIIHSQESTTQEKSNFFLESIHNLRTKKNQDIIKYFFSEKKEKEEYVTFLKNIIFYAQKHGVFTEYLDDILQDIQVIEKNNVLARNVVDKWIISLF